MAAESREALLLRQSADVLEQLHRIVRRLRHRGLDRAREKPSRASRPIVHDARAAFGQHAHLQAQLLERRPLHLGQLVLRERVVP